MANTNSYDFGPLIRAQEQAKIKSIEEQRTFKDMLEDRTARVNALTDEGSSRMNKFFKEGSPEVPVNPMDVMNIYGNMKQAARNYVTPYKDLYEESKNEGKTASDELYKWLGLQQNQQQQLIQNQIAAKEAGMRFNPETGQPEEIMSGEEGYKMSDSEARELVMKEPGGLSFWNSLGGSTPERADALRTIIQEWGSLDNYRQNTDVMDLYTEKQKKDAEGMGSILSTATAALDYFKDYDSPWFGIKSLSGPFQDKILQEPKQGFFAGPGNWIRSGYANRRSDERVTAQQLITSLSADKIKELSGAAVSVEEMNRLSPYLPRLRDQENVVKTKLENMIKMINVNNDVREYAARNNLSNVEAFNEVGKELMIKYGLDQENQSQSQGTSGWLDEDDEGLINKIKNERK